MRRKVGYNYTAFGLKIAAISSKKLPDPNEGNVDNKNLYNDKELWDDADLNWYDYGFRNYDPQIGRFPQLDPLTDDYPELTNYQYASNEPIANVDMDGLELKNSIFNGAGLSTPGGFWNGSYLQVAGRQSTLKVVGQGAKVITMNAVKSPGFWATVGTKLLGVSGAVLSPLPAGEGSYRPAVLTLPKPKGKDEEEKDDNITLYRGVGEEKGLMYDFAKEGYAYPKGLMPGAIFPHDNPERHTYGDNNSIYTSWSQYKSEAKRFVRGRSKKKGGVILIKKFKRSQLKKSKLSATPDFEHEGEYLAPGIIKADGKEIIPGKK